MTAARAGSGSPSRPARGWIGFAVLVLAGCASPQPPPSQPVAEKPAPTATPVVETPKTAAGQAAGAREEPVSPLTGSEGEIVEGEACLSCHSAELIQAARIGVAGWSAEVNKMRGWGALVDEAKSAPLANWFARRYPAAEPAPPPAMISPADAKAEVAPERDKRPLRGDRTAGAALYAKDCAACHGANAEGTGGGPVLIEAPAIHQRTRFTELVLKGKGRMPAAQGIADAEISNLLVFLRALH